MPCITESSKRNFRVKNRQKGLKAYILLLIKEKGLSSEKCAEALEISKSGFSRALNNMTFNTYKLFTLLDYLEADPEEVAFLLARKK